MLGARRGHREVVEFLISKGADVSLVDVHGNNFLHWACCGGDVEMVKFILSQKMADINSRGVSNMTPVMWAAYRGHSEVVEFLMCEGADVSLVDVNGNNILHWACEGGDAQIVKFVLSLDKMDIDARNEKGQTAADFARLWGHHKVVDVLVSRCAQ
ncbi:inversin-A-like [Haliotis rufescens]|uniref:inversin-A-like n=1 Tax=Haliotis rufescens TaxID=6454 RepID=UPI00201F17BB|nr:inversin-A-like [Haliotis rufescens]